MIPVLRGVVDATIADTSAAPLLVLGPSLGTTAAAWSAAAQRLRGRFRIVRFDLPGHGGSPAATHPFTVAELAAGVVALVDSLGGGRFVYAGVSLGGAIGVELALGPAASRLGGLAIVCSNTAIGSPEGWHDRAAQVRAQGTASTVRGSTERWFAPSFLTREPDVVGAALNALLEVDDESYARCCEALAVFDRRADAGAISARVLVVHGEADPVVTPADAAALAESIPGAQRSEFADTGHQPQLERPEALASLLLEQFPPATDAGDSRYEAGLAVRREVLGSTHVDASLAGRTAETTEFQRFITETAWGSIWTRPGLDRRMRSAVTLSSLVTGHHWNELAMHVRAGLRNGLSREELTEILLQTAIYAGVPAANSAFGVLKQVLADVDAAAARDTTGTGRGDDGEER